MTGVGEVAAIGLQVIRESATLYLRKRRREPRCFATRRGSATFWRMRIGALGHEVFAVAYLDSRVPATPQRCGDAPGRHDRPGGGVSRRVVEAALRRQAAGLVLAHNHPSGNVAPSEHDKVLTRAIVLAAETIGLRVVDHLIVSPEETFSFRKAGLL